MLSSRCLSGAHILVEANISSRDKIGVVEAHL